VYTSMNALVPHTRLYLRLIYRYNVLVLSVPYISYVPTNIVLTYNNLPPWRVRHTLTSNLTGGAITYLKRLICIRFIKRS